MQQQLNRIKNKDLSKMDQRLFANLDKIQTIDSTLQNLGQFQQFLLQQITQFEQKAKQKNNDRQVAQVIQQNCSTLRESIMRVVPEIQQTHSRLRMSHLSPVNGFRSTGFEKWKAMERNRNKQIQQNVQLESKGSKTSIESNSKVQSIKSKQNSGYIEKLREKIKQLTNELVIVKSLQKQLGNDLLRVKESIKDQVQTKVSVQLKGIMCQNIFLKKQNQSFKLTNKQLTQQNSKLSEELKKLNGQLRNLSKQNNKFFQQKSQQQVSNKVQQKREYKSFMEKIKSEFSTKFKNTYNTSYEDNKNNRIQQKQPQCQSTFRQSTNIKESNLYLNVNIQGSSYFGSVQMTRNKNGDDTNIKNDKLVETDMNVPRLLRRNSVVGSMCFNNYNNQESIKNNNCTAIINNTFNQTASKIKTRTKIAINQLNKQILVNDYVNNNNNKNIKSKSTYQRHQQQQSNYQLLLQKHPTHHNNSNSTSKKTNHDLMRKTKSNFFTNNNNNLIAGENNKQNYFMTMTQTKIQFDKTTHLFKSNQLTNNNDKHQLKRRSQSKQKLKIVSLL